MFAFSCVAVTHPVSGTHPRGIGTLAGTQNAEFDLSELLHHESDH